MNGKFSDGRPVNHQAVAIPVQSITTGSAGGFGGTTGSLGTPRNVLPATFDPAQRPTLVQAQAPACSILSLTLGPLHLDLLGLVVALNQINLDITAQPGSGDLLGNLLCAVADLLNGTNGLGGALTGLAGALNNLVNTLNGVLAGL